MAAIGSAWVRPGGNESTDSLVLCDCHASLQVVRGEALERLRTNEFQPSPLPKLLGFMGTGTRRSRTQRPAVLFPPGPQGDVGGGIASSDFYPHPPNTASRVSYDRRKSRLTSLRITNVDLHHIIAPDDMTARQCAARLGLSAVGPGLRHPFASPQAQRSHSTPIIATSNSCSSWSRNRPCSNRRPSHVMASAVLHRKLRSISGHQPQTAESFHDRQEQHQETGPASSQAG
ncbi:hypothetical protein ASPVEDRAFT_347766 [Aspergillus versicolor CBS 583.65]|uniref:Uncharacterized protein n=1 Tax=Aspergillus versicolor CBS 583.65 TaxID=1036611 RepID=A0A1L9PZJ3_ASPVE|nr:uncharacterized protein ASPVEDRAFT_347766 [Aspergillus versicolor CBS 583.65]OJJ06934.1 hypothetical protein ASPVEDRAFT_347766 [Aspergillus versicolor CBS 583.65]